MTHKELKTLRNLPENDLNGKLILLFSEVWKFHSRGVCLSPFTWEDVTLAPDGTLHLAGVEERPYDNDTRLQNLRDYAGVLFCAATGSKSAAGMDDEAFGKIDSDVLREIVLSLIIEGDGVTHIVRKLRRPYIDTETFFSDFKTKFRKTVEPEPDEEEKAERRRNILSRSFFGTLAVLLVAAIIAVIANVNNTGEKPMITSDLMPVEETAVVDTAEEKYYPGPAEYADAAEEESDDRYPGRVVTFPSTRPGYPSRSVYIPGPKKFKVPTVTIPKRSSLYEFNKKMEKIRDPKTGRFKTIEGLKLPEIIEAERARQAADTAGAK